MDADTRSGRNAAIDNNNNNNNNLSQNNNSSHPNYDSNSNQLRSSPSSAARALPSTLPHPVPSHSSSTSFPTRSLSSSSSSSSSSSHPYHHHPQQQQQQQQQQHSAPMTYFIPQYASTTPHQSPTTHTTYVMESKDNSGYFSHPPVQHTYRPVVTAFEMQQAFESQAQPQSPFVMVNNQQLSPAVTPTVSFTPVNQAQPTPVFYLHQQPPQQQQQQPSQYQYSPQQPIQQQHQPSPVLNHPQQSHLLPTPPIFSPQQFPSSPPSTPFLPQFQPFTTLTMPVVQSFEFIPPSSTSSYPQTTMEHAVRFDLVPSQQQHQQHQPQQEVYHMPPPPFTLTANRAAHSRSSSLSTVVSVEPWQQDHIHQHQQTVLTNSGSATPSLRSSPHPVEFMNQLQSGQDAVPSMMDAKEFQQHVAQDQDAEQSTSGKENAKHHPYKRPGRKSKKAAVAAVTAKPSSSDEEESGDISGPAKRPSLTCPQCSRTFTRRSNLTSHLLTHPPSPDSPSQPTSSATRHACPHCPHTFLRPHDLTRHIRTKHTVDRPFQCPTCPATFSRGDSLKKHMECERRGTAKGPYSVTVMRVRAAEEARREVGRRGGVGVGVVVGDNVPIVVDEVGGVVREERSEPWNQGKMQ
ncbi:hypothetical protein HDU97_002835 [Phlyctochytrium planicorne]|nr:hypothetical protein HDU97_002835 [Phlyctochytrium planicorne]